MDFETIFDKIYNENEELDTSLTTLKEAEDFLQCMPVNSEAALLSHEISVARFLATGEPISSSEIGSDRYYGRAYTRPTVVACIDSRYRESMHRVMHRRA